MGQVSDRKWPLGWVLKNLTVKRWGGPVHPEERGTWKRVPFRGNGIVCAKGLCDKGHVRTTTQRNAEVRGRVEGKDGIWRVTDESG